MEIVPRTFICCADKPILVATYGEMVAKKHICIYICQYSYKLEYVFEFVFCMQALSGEFSCIRKRMVASKFQYFEYTDGKLDR